MTMVGSATQMVSPNWLNLMILFGWLIMWGVVIRIFLGIYLHRQLLKAKNHLNPADREILLRNQYKYFYSDNRITFLEIILTLYVLAYCGFIKAITDPQPHLQPDNWLVRIFPRIFIDHFIPLQCYISRLSFFTEFPNSSVVIFFCLIYAYFAISSYRYLKKLGLDDSYFLIKKRYYYMTATYLGCLLFLLYEPDVAYSYAHYLLLWC